MFMFLAHKVIGYRRRASALRYALALSASPITTRLASIRRTGPNLRMSFSSFSSSALEKCFSTKAAVIFPLNLWVLTQYTSSSSVSSRIRHREIVFELLRIHKRGKGRSAPTAMNFWISSSVSGRATVLNSLPHPRHFASAADATFTVPQYGQRTTGAA